VIVAGTVSACLLTLLVLPVMYQQWTQWLGKPAGATVREAPPEATPVEG
jgi:hypothetical protein